MSLDCRPLRPAPGGRASGRFLTERTVIPVTIWKFLHLFFAFSYVGTLMLADWVGRAARGNKDWAQRALLYDIIRIASSGPGIGSLLALGILGNVLAAPMDHSHRGSWMMTVNLLWLASVVVAFVLTRPAIAKLASISKAAGGGGASDGYDAALSRWRLGNILATVLYLALLAIMVFRW